MREELINKISYDILNRPNVTWGNVIKEVELYFPLLEDTIRNFYEFYSLESSDCPLFSLYYFIKEGQTCFTDSASEYKEMLTIIEKKLNTKFDIKIKNIGYYSK